MDTRVHFLTPPSIFRDLEETLVKFPEFKPVIATNAMALVLRNRVLCPGLCGISRESADQLARRMCHQKVSFTDGQVICQGNATSPPAKLPGFIVCDFGFSQDGSAHRV